MGPTEQIIEIGYIIIIDTGAIYGGYFCDFDPGTGNNPGIKQTNGKGGKYYEYPRRGRIPEQMTN